jgi:hypothetical protein
MSLSAQRISTLFDTASGPPLPYSGCGSGSRSLERGPQGDHQSLIGLRNPKTKFNGATGPVTIFP